MTDRSGEKEVERPPEKSTEDLLAETDRLLAELDGSDDGNSESKRSESERSKSRESPDGEFGMEFDPGQESKTRGDGPTTDSEGWRRIFNPKSFVLAAVLLAAGYLVGAMAPLGGLGSWLGILVAAFSYGLGTSKGRYPETALAGAGIGLVTALFNRTAMLFLANGQGELVLGLGAFLGLLAGLVGYYFGSDLRKGLTSGPDDFEDDLSW
ncbi:hypothetical protein [Haloarchaeobius sp. TZWWS8]|uniref:hypothetical protein n=1 Tax=Haloarchaeobius sp. TZWWS8 TaxID=3446121 RepID=UPI003EB7FF05